MSFAHWKNWARNCGAAFSFSGWVLVWMRRPPVSLVEERVKEWIEGRGMWRSLVGEGGLEGWMRWRFLLVNISCTITLELKTLPGTFSITLQEKCTYSLGSSSYM